METKYIIFCSNCNKQTPHRVWKVNRMRGVKLRCLSCGIIKNRYHKLSKLKEKEVLSE